MFASFVAWLIDPKRRARERQLSFGKVIAALAAGYLAIVMAIAVAAPPFHGAPASGEFYDSPVTVGRILISRYALTFVLSGTMLFAAAAAAVIVARPAGRRGPEEEEE